jgi:hypothetical protein
MPSQVQSQRITLFRIDLDEDNRVGASTFKSGKSGRAEVEWKYTIQDASGDIAKCTITAKLILVSTSEIVARPTSYCDSRYGSSFYRKGDVEIGEYRIEAEVYVPTSEQSAKTSQRITVT